jgi:microcystin-dependent protein
MDQPFVGVIFAHAGTYAPNGWRLCQGQTLPISENEVLFTLIGTTYGGNGQTTFNLPDLRGRLPIGQGQGLGLSNYVIGQAAGTETVTLTTGNLPVHSHLLNVNNVAGTVPTPISSSYIAGTVAGTTGLNFYSGGPGSTTMGGNTIGNSGGSTPISILQPILCTSYIISLFGIFPSRN